MLTLRVVAVVELDVLRDALLDREAGRDVDEARDRQVGCPGDAERDGLAEVQVDGGSAGRNAELSGRELA